ncbi:MAG: hypothetical protein ABI844_01465 [Saprospiraceae bacterium]
MKLTNTLIIAFFLTMQISNAQVMESQKVMSKGQNMSLSIEIPDVSADFTDDVFKDFIKDFKGKTKKDKKANEWFSDNAKVASIANGAPIDIYSKIESNGNKSVVNLWIDLGAGYVSSSTYPREYEEAQKLLEKFAQTVQVRKAEDELSIVEKDAKKLDGDMKKLLKDNDDYHKDIEKCNQKIKEAEQNIVKNEDDQRSKKAAIDSQSSKVEDARTKLNNVKKM